MTLLTHASRALALLLVGVGLAACDPILDSIFDPYEGPDPSKQPLTDERVILRATERVIDGVPQHYYLDRVQFLERADSSNIDRIIIGMPGGLQGTIDSLDLKRGDALVISTKFHSIGYSRGLEAYIPNWAANRYKEDYPVALHTLLAIEKVGPAASSGTAAANRQQPGNPGALSASSGAP
ncbi:hypothetical protein [Longimicrobium sp.]|jgi:hypothetical protein|uniref:hypothetical protein n=1 Tax=Longimicrobium sp. TaxID=2029185 RepID=UPI002F957113